MNWKQLFPHIRSARRGQPRTASNLGKTGRLFPVLLLLALLPWLLWGNLELAASGHTDIRRPVEAVLTWTGQPGLHRTVTLSAQVTSEAQAGDLSLHWNVPPGVSLSCPVAESLGSIAAGQTVIRQCDATFDRAGTFKVAASAQVEARDRPAVYGGADVLFFTIRQGRGSQVSRQGPGISSVRERIDTPNVRYSVTAEPTRPEAGFWVSGRVMYRDIPIDSSAGPGSPVLVPARQVKVAIWEEDRGLPDDHQGTVRTDDDGYFSFWVSNNEDGYFDNDGKEIYLRIFPDTPGGYVTDRGAADNRYLLETGIHQGGQNIDFGTMTPTTFDPMFNISDVLLDGYRYISQFRSPPEHVKARYEPGYDPITNDGSWYDSILERINLSGEDQDPDGYDDTVIIHEYGHFIADKYACDDSFGGDHSAYRHYSKRLAWSEGWSNYLSSAVRGSSWYLDYDWNGGWVIKEDWEVWDIKGSTNEGAVCATLWDIHDDVDEAHDRLSLGGSRIWSTFQNRMGGSVPVSWTDCNIDAFWDGWLEAGYPDDSELAAIFAHHDTAGVQATSVNSAGGVAEAAAQQAPAANPIQVGLSDGSGDLTSPAAPDTIVGTELPWNATLFLVDATNSMADEISAVRQIIQNQVSDMDAEPEPYEYIVETFQDDGTNTFVADHFFPDVVNPPVGSITVGGGSTAPEDSFAALARGTRDRVGYDAWLLTDAAPKLEITGAELEGLLQNREITPYFFIFGDCTGDNLASAGAAEEAPRPAPLNWLRLPRFESAGLEECIEPYLLVASATNGQFLLIDTGQINNAAEIVRAFMNNNAGAGRYADYVSSSWTYGWDDTDYDWYDATGGERHNYCSQDRATVALPQPFSFYGATYNTLYASRSGYASFTDSDDVPANTPIPTFEFPNNAVYAFWDAIWDVCVPKVEEPSQYRGVYTEHDAANGRYVIEYYDFLHVGSSHAETFEILLDFATGEIIVQYQDVTDDSSCTVGVENANGTAATQVIYNNPLSLYDGRAIKFTPLPPQPTKDHDVIVDSTMDSVIFLLNGFSGVVNLTVYRPNGTPLTPGDSDVTFMDLDKIKYYRVDNPAAGTWIARASGEGTYYFTSSASSGLVADYQGDVTLNSLILQPLSVDLGMAVSSATFSLVNAGGDLIDYVDMYDDGAHDDGEANDGLYAGHYYPAGVSGTFYLQVNGQTISGEDFRRADLTPIRFQRMAVMVSGPAEQFVKPGQSVEYSFVLSNYDSNNEKCFWLDRQSSHGWAYLSAGYICVPPNSFLPFLLQIQTPTGTEGEVEITTVTAQAATGPGMADSVTVVTTVRGAPDAIDLAAYPDRIPPGGYQATIVAQVADGERWNVADGTQVEFWTTLGTLDLLSATTVDGLISATLTSGAATGIAQVQANIEYAGLLEMVSVEISIAPAYSLTVQASPNSLPPDGTSTSQLTAHVYDLFGGPAPDGSQVVFVVDGDDMSMGSIEGSETYTATTTAGIATATYRSGTTVGWATIRAEIPPDSLTAEGENTGSVRWAETRIRLGSAIYLPTVLRSYP